jgi:hypothetical protein
MQSSSDIHLSRRLLTTVFLVSFTGLAFEVTLTRVFSISLSYHFAYMVVSIAMMGLAASGTALSLAPSLRQVRHIGLYCLLLGVTVSGSYLVANQVPFDPVALRWSEGQILYIALYYVTLAVPFFFTGLIVATALSNLSERAGLLYGADLIGAGLGSLGVLWLLTLIPPDRVVFVLSLVALVSSLLPGRRSLILPALVAMALNVAILVGQPGFATLRMSPYKGLPSALQYPGAEHLKTYVSAFSVVDTFRSPAVRFAPGLSLRYLDPLPDQIGFSIDGGEVNAVTSTVDRKALAFLRFLPSALPYEVGTTEDVLVIDPKGGLQVLLAREYGSRNLIVTESNPSVAKVLRDQFRDLSPGLYDEHAQPGPGRLWVSASGREFDIIDMPLVNVQPYGSFGMAEDYRFTVEAVREYLSHLKPRGLLSINLYILSPPRTELRLLTTILRALAELGVHDGARHIAALRSWGTVCLLVKREPLTPADSEAIRRFSADRRFDLVYLEGIREEETNLFVRTTSNEYFRAFQRIVDPASREAFQRDYIFDIEPVTDDRPFFSHHLRTATIGETYRAMGGKWYFFIEEGYLLPAVLLQVLVLGLILIFLPALQRRRGPENSQSVKGSSRFSFLLYFALLGLAFMFVEIPILQKAMLPLEHPTHAVGTVLTALLAGSGAGSLLSNKMSLSRSSLAVLCLSFLTILYAAFLPPAVKALAGYPLSLKMALVFAALLPLGFPMGIPFPAGLTLMGERQPWLIPWAWAVNGFFSVVAPVVAAMIALTFGFTAVLILGALAYFAAYLLIRQLGATGVRVLSRER